jgi:hypothetical protein
MCRNIKQLHNFEPHATDEEIRAAALQFVRKISGFREPSQANITAFNRGVDDVAHATKHLLDALVTSAPPRNRQDEAVKAKIRSIQRFGDTTKS